MSRKPSARRKKPHGRIASKPKPPPTPPELPPAATLAELQGFLHRFIVAPGADPEVYRRNERDIARWIKASPTMRPSERVGVYRWQYWVRLEQAMGRDYPVTARFMGPEQFKRAIREYLVGRVPSSFNITRVRDAVPEFLGNLTWTRHTAFLRDLATLERTIGEVYDAPEVPVLPPERWPGTPQGSLDLRPIEALNVRAYTYPVHQFLKAPFNASPQPFLAPNRNWVVVYRKKFEVWRIPLSEKAYQLLCKLAEGVNLDTAIRQVTGQDKAVHEELHRWLGQWLREGFFRDTQAGA